MHQPMMAGTPEVSRILLVEDSEDDAQLLLAELAKLGRPIETAPRRDRGRDGSGAQQQGLGSRDLRHRLPRFDSIRGQPASPDAPRRPVRDHVGTLPEETAATVVRLSANDFIDKSKPAPSCRSSNASFVKAKLRRANENAKETLRQLTYVDSLTGLAERRMLVEDVDRHLRARAPGDRPRCSS